jgi:hypothetical protein
MTDFNTVSVIIFPSCRTHLLVAAACGAVQLKVRGTEFSGGTGAIFLLTPEAHSLALGSTARIGTGNSLISRAFGSQDRSPLSQLDDAAILAATIRAATIG